MNRYNRLKQTVTYFSLALVLLYQLMIPVAQVSAQPERPERPSAPEAPSAPDAPEAPDRPEREDESDSDSESDNEEKDLEESEPNDSENAPDNDSSKSEESPADETDESAESQDESQTTNNTESPTQGETTTPTTNSSNTQGNQVGDSEIETGDANTTVGVASTANTNTGTTSKKTPGSVNLSNDSNGTETSNGNTVDLSNKSNNIQDNNANIGNNVVADSQTGANDNSRNVGGNSVTETGDANVSATVIATANTNAAGIQANEFNIVDDYVGDIVLDVNNPCQQGCEAGEVIVLDNNGNGSGSDNSNEVTYKDESNTFQNNDAHVENNIILEANSGDNTSTDNTGGDTSIETGDANVSANVASFLNNNIAGEVVVNTVNVFGDLVGDIIAPESTSNAEECATCDDAEVVASNSGNGGYTDNTNNFSHSEEDLVIQENDANINNTLALDTNTGGNKTSDNTNGESSIETGKSNVEANVVNVANQNVSGGDWWIVLVNQAGEWVGQIVGAPEGATMAGSQDTQFKVNADGSIDITNGGNGSGSNNSNSVTQSEKSTTVQTNQAALTNNLQLTANTGNNDASRNTGGNSNVKTGDADIVANVVNFVNNNIASGGKVTVTMVNVFGSWIGDFVGPDSQKQARTLEAPVTEDSVANNQVETEIDESPAIGGYVDETTQVEIEKNTESQVKQTEKVIVYEQAQTQVQSGVNSQARRFTNQIRRTSARVLGVNESVSNGLGSTNETVATDEFVATDAPGNQVNTPVQVKVGWPALITSFLGLIYAGLRVRGMFG